MKVNPDEKNLLDPNQPVSNADGARKDDRTPNDSMIELAQ